MHNVNLKKQLTIDREQVKGRHQTNYLLIMKQTRQGNRAKKTAANPWGCGGRELIETVQALAD